MTTPPVGQPPTRLPTLGPTLGATLGPTFGDELGLSLDPERMRRLRRMKRTASGLLALAAALFVVSFWLPDTQWVHFLRAASEAGMVGGLADWFAVTALFRHPLGLPIPHTALIPTRKDAIAAQLGEFVTGHFLTREVIGQHLAKASPVPKAAAWLASPDRARALSHEIAVGAKAVLAHLPGADELAGYVLTLARDTLRSTSLAPVLGRLLQQTIEEDRHRPLVDVVVGRVRGWLQDDRERIVPWLKAEIENTNLLGLFWATDKRVHKLLDRLDTLAQEMAESEHHQLRRLLDDLLLHVAGDLQSNAQTAASIDEFLERSLQSPKTRAELASVLGGGLDALAAALEEENGAFVQWLSRWVVDLAERATSDAEFRAQLELWLERIVLHLVDEYADEFTRIVEDTVNRWDGAATAARIESAVGRDLQFIRINGTVIGALAGMAIYTVSLLLT